MQLTIFFVEVILLFFYLEWDKVDNFIESPKDEYSSYYSKDIIGNEIIEFSSIENESKKIKVLKESELIDKIVNHTPKIEIMSDILRDGVEDKSSFTDDFIEYMKSLHFKYLGQEITIDEFRESIKNPRNIHSIN